MLGKCKKGVRLGGQGGCEPRIELIVKMHKSREEWGRGSGRGASVWK